MVTWKEVAAAEPDLADVGRSLLFQFRRPSHCPHHPDVSEVAGSGQAVLVDDSAVRAGILRDARHMADASETAFELLTDRVMHTWWENVLTPKMRSVHTKWRAPAASAPSS